MVNQTIDDCSRVIEERSGLQSFEMNRFADQNELTYWPFGQIVSKSPHLHTLKIVYMKTTPENSSTIMQFCREICHNSDSLSTLHLVDVGSSAEDGDQFWSSLADDDQCLNGALQELVIVLESEWFKDDRTDTLVPFTRVLSRNTSSFKECFIESCKLFPEQIQAINDALAENPDCIQGFQFKGYQ